MTADITIYQSPFGKLTWDSGLDWWVSDELPIPMFGGRLLTISFQADNPSAPISDAVIKAVTAMLRLESSTLDSITPHVWGNYHEFRDAVGADEIEAIEPSEDIWAHVQPGAAMVDERDGEVYVSFECNCDWEIERGLMLVLKDGVRWVKVSAYNGHFTDGHAYAKPRLDDWINDPDAKLPIRTFAQMMAVPGGPD